MILSIITINYNNAAGLQQTLNSVIGQKFKDFEYIVIDGGSTDGSVDIINENKQAINYWISEKDNGIYRVHNCRSQVHPDTAYIFGSTIHQVPCIVSPVKSHGKVLIVPVDFIFKIVFNMPRH